MGARAQTLESLGRYEVLGVLATGGMAEVLLARVNGPSGFERPVVIKRILPHLARERVFRDMFLDESKIVARIRHRNVVAVHELGEEASELFLVMEYLEGESLAAIQRRLRLKKEKLPVRVAAHIVAEACAGLHAAHELSDADGKPLGIVHRDVSPHNVFVLYDGQVKVIDFGIAKTAESTQKTQTGQIKGKFSYMAPEQVRAETLDRRTDVFSLGIVLWETSTGERLFEREHDLLVFKALCEDAIAKPSSHREGYPAALEAVCTKALSRAPGDRYDTALAMRRDLLAVERSLGGDSQPPEEELAAIVRGLFEERFARKRDLLARIQRGANVTTVAFVDDSFPTGGDLQIARAMPSSRSIDIVEPAVSSGPTGSGVGTNAALLSTNSGVPQKRSPLIYAIPALAAVLVGGLAAFGLRDKQAPGGAAQTAAPQASTVIIDLWTNPDGARVRVDGKEKGTTPLAVVVDRADSEILIEIEKDGYQSERQHVRPTTDQKLSVSLALAASAKASAKPAGSAASAPAAGPKKGGHTGPPAAAPKPTATGGFQRFD